MARIQLFLLVLSVLAAIFGAFTGHRILTDDLANPDIGIICFGAAGICLTIAIGAYLDLKRELAA
jgi:hypothetical protein